MPDVRVMNWNIQNFGVTKSGQKYNNDDVIAAIAETVVDSHCDIFVMLEMNTTDLATARSLASDMRDYLRKKSPTDFATVVLSPNTGREFYAFFVRDHALTIPAPLQSIDGAPAGAALPTTLGHGFTPLAKAVFQQEQAGDVSNRFFPLLAPDVALGGLNAGTRTHLPNWPGSRRPALGLFRIAGATAGNAYLPILACHYSADKNRVQQGQQVNDMRNFSLLHGLAPGVAATARAKLKVRTLAGAAATTYTPKYWCLLGDFNLDLIDDAPTYDPLLDNTNNALGADATNSFTNTHMITPVNFTTRNQHTTKDLAVALYDNFFIRMLPGQAKPVTFFHRDVIDLADLVKTRKVQLKASVKHYAELDKRGFKAGDYAGIASDFQRQLAGSKSHEINLGGALAGARLISDHLPVLVDLTIP